MSGCKSDNECTGALCSGGSSERGVDNPEPEIVVTPNTSSPIGAKNYLQINNTYSSLTNIPTNEEVVLSEFNAVITQLPTTSNPEALNGFNHIAQTRLAFAYCNQYVDENESDYAGLSNDAAIRSLLDNMVDLDVDNNSAHQTFYQNLMDIMNDTDQLLGDTVVSEEPEETTELEVGVVDVMDERTKKLFKMSCAALLASSYVSMM